MWAESAGEAGEAGLAARSREWRPGASIQRGRVSVSEAQGAPPPHPCRGPRPAVRPGCRAWRGWERREGELGGGVRSSGKEEAVGAVVSPWLLGPGFGRQQCPWGAVHGLTRPSAPGSLRRCGWWGPRWSSAAAGTGPGQREADPRDLLSACLAPCSADVTALSCVSLCPSVCLCLSLPPSVPSLRVCLLLLSPVLSSLLCLCGQLFFSPSL